MAFTANLFLPPICKRLTKNIKGEFLDEISLARVQASHLAELMKDYKNMSLEDYVSASNALNNYSTVSRASLAPKNISTRIRPPQKKPLKNFHRFLPSKIEPLYEAASSRHRMLRRCERRRQRHETQKICLRLGYSFLLRSSGTNPAP